MQLSRHIYRFFVEAIVCEIVQFFFFFHRQRDLWEFFYHGPHGRMNTWLFLNIFVNIDGHRTGGGAFK